MAGSYACCNFCWNPSLTAKDKLASAAPTKDSSTPTPTSAVSHALTTAPAIAPFSDNKLFKQFIKAYLDLQVPGQIKVNSKPCKQPLKA